MKPQDFGYEIAKVPDFLAKAREDLVGRFNRDLREMDGSHVLFDPHDDDQGFMVRGSEAEVTKAWEELDYPA
ncbi:hypothetical protein [Epibacterium ulvae]|uniref:hypothetical protein n=1 Tax=Epibacterium ulvae TaxID=1156985 RepID=UPI0024905D8A|nr:hypothetical protein [Epibacterium ulvae]